jgi:hypothetical protein
MKKSLAHRPTPQKKVDEHVARLTALISIILALAGMYHPVYWILLTLDLLVRLLGPRFSPTNYFNSCLLNLVNIKPKPVAVAPKKFATQIALFLMLLVLVLNYFGLYFGVKIALGALVIALTLFAVFNFCFACNLYPFFNATRKK